VVVGSHTEVAGTEGLTLVEWWNGSNWKVQPSPNPTGATDSSLQSVSCVSITRCVAVGSSSGAGGQVPLAERWNGVKWSIMFTPNPQTNQSSKLTAVSCPSATFCAAVGYTTQTDAQDLPLFETWNGASWSIQPIPTGAFDISCTSATDCTAVGDAAWHWDGTSWSIERILKLPMGGGLGGISCTSPAACTAVGSFGNPDGYTEYTLAARWNGTKWTIQHPRNRAGGAGAINQLTAVSCASDNECMAVGYWNAPCHGGYACQGIIAEQWNGTAWKLRYFSDPNGHPPIFDAVSCPSTTRCIAINGRELIGQGEGTAAWDGTSWTEQPGPS
jgi:hypothetical protein